MREQHLFHGRAVEPVDAAGLITLPPFVIDMVERQSQGIRLFIGMHERDPCLRAFDECYGGALLAEAERRRIDDERSGRPNAEHRSRMRRMFGFVERAAVDWAGRVKLPEALRRKACIRGSALIIGVGESFEIWSPRIARDAADPELRELACLRAPQSSRMEGELVT